LQWMLLKNNRPWNETEVDVRRLSNTCLAFV
jgi:hypothetical protein